ncbi:MAG: addiction module protein [Gammaproteobacteria bacterium]|nr:addiction module protein [Gammaproteobacteria bacterium]
MLDIDNSSNADALIDYIRSLDYVSIEEDNADIPDWQKKELDKRWATYLKNPEKAQDLDEALEELDKELL